MDLVATLTELGEYSPEHLPSVAGLFYAIADLKGDVEQRDALAECLSAMTGMAPDALHAFMAKCRAEARQLQQDCPF